MNRPPNTFELGTAVKITTILNVASPNSVKITIKNPSGVITISADNMVMVSPTAYTYVFQSDVAGVDGEYKIIIDAAYTSGPNTYTSRVIQCFTLLDTDD